MGVINPFVPDPAAWILPIAWIGWLATVAAIGLRRRAQRIAAPVAQRG